MDRKVQRQAFRAVFLLTCALSLCLQVPTALAQTSNTITLQVDKPGADISPTMFGIFFEDINFGADGGLYPERVKNRSFEFPEPLMAWKQIDRGSSKGSITVLTESPINEVNAHYLHFDVSAAGKGFGVMNEGFRGMGFQRGVPYVLSLFARNPVRTQRAGNARLEERAPVVLRVELEDQNGQVLAGGRLLGFSPDWKKHSLVLRPTATSMNAHLNVFVERGSSIDLDVVSLFPIGTWKNRENGKIVVGRADKITGPYLDRNGKAMIQAGGTLLMESSRAWRGPGGQSVFRDASRYLMAFHSYDAQTGRANLMISPGKTAGRGPGCCLEPSFHVSKSKPLKRFT